ncbi:DNA polymerase-4 [Anaerospora hongkongensis]|uniref:DNA polymerase IV n=1 Tax=Anaerospora hongkongensis TaxID=244830 RepID=A0A4R1PZS1_9FIRM|nr:DNA polymerase-4 [Anaerospora hongkongensis]
MHVQRYIIHVDMDAFYASIEQRDKPELAGVPVIVGGLSNRGVVATASYEARKFGVHSAMSMAEARRRCPEAVFITPDHRKYSFVSAQIRQILDRYSPLVEPLSLDEAFLDVTGMDGLYADPVDIARRIKDEIKQQLQLTASAGVAPNKFLAKLASDLQKPDGLYVIRRGEEAQVLAGLPVRRLWGVGEVTAASIAKLGIGTIGQFAAADPKLLERHIGRDVYDLQRLARGLDDRPVVPDQQIKSVGNEETFDQDLYQWDEIEKQLLLFADKVGWRLRRLTLSGRTITVKVRFASFKTITRSRTLEEATNLDDTLYHIARELYKSIPSTEGIRLLGLTVSNLQPAGQAMALFDSKQEKQESLHKVVDELKVRFGAAAVMKGRLIDPHK